MKLIVVFMMVLSAIPRCSSNLKIQGRWVSRGDANYVVKITEDRFYEIYKKDTSFYNFIRSSKSCDTTYLSEAKNPILDFISLDDGRCFEITGLTESSLSYRHTVSGKMQIFYKVENK